MTSARRRPSRYPVATVLLTILATLVTLAVPSRGAAGDDVLRNALRDELARSMSQLRLADLDKPYFIAYAVKDGTAWRTSASLGALLDKTEARMRFLTVEVRVGSPQSDNSNFFSSPTEGAGLVQMFTGTARLPLDDDYRELRRQIWLATDAAYKKALEDISRKRAAMRNRTATDQLPDFSKEEPVQITDARQLTPVDLEAAARMVRDLSALFRQAPGVFASKVLLAASNIRTLYVNSEGTSFVRNQPMASIVALAETQATDGMPLRDFVSVSGRTLEELSKDATLSTRVRQMSERLQQLRQAPLLERYNGPVLFEGQAAAEVFSQVMAPKFLAQRRPVAESLQVEAYLAMMDESFIDKLGARVLPESFSVADDPSLSETNRMPLLGGYAVDDEGVRARKTTLVDKGILQTLLAGRSPVSGITQSTGSSRSAGILPSNLIVNVEKGLSDQELRAQFLKLVQRRGKPYGIVVRHLENPAYRAAGAQLSANFTPPNQGEEKVEDPILAYKVYPDGREELTRNAEISDLNTAAFKDIVAASKTLNVYTCPFATRALSLYSMLAAYASGEATQGAPLVSFAVPSLLFDDLTVKKHNGQMPTPPLSPSPLAVN